MGVEREVIEKPGYRGAARPVRAQRSAAGAWSVDFEMAFEIPLEGGARHIRVIRRIRVRAEQIGRKKMSMRFVPARRAPTVTSTQETT